MLLSSLVLTLFSPLVPIAVAAFSFTTSTNDPTQCGQVDVEWTGGTPPFRMLVMPAFDYPTNISIPDNAWSGGSGSYQWTVNYPSGTDFVLLMSDATGLGMGGVSRLYRVGAASGGASCTLRSEQTDFFFYLNETSVNQCDPVEVYWDDTATAPVTILGVIPQGQPFQFASTGSATSYVWNTNIAAGTQFILGAFNAGRTGIGGSSSLLTVGAGSSSCLDESSPSSTPVGSPTASETGTRTGGGGGVKTVTSITTAVPAGAAGLSTGAIAGIAIAAVVVVLVVQGLIFWFCCRRQLAALLSHRKQMRERTVKPGDVDLADDPEGEGADRATSLQNVRTRDTSNRLSMSGILSGPRTRSSVGGETFEAESSISPYFDPGQTNSSGYLPVSPHRGPFDSPPEDEFAPPQAGHLRNDSLSSTNSNSRGLILNLDTSPSILSLPQFSPNGGNAASPYPAVPPAAYTRPTGSQPQQPTQGQSPAAQQPTQTKAQMAASLSAQNPDTAAGGLFGGRQPPAQAPSGGFMFHEDAGRADDMEELPPMYRPEWEAESQRGSRPASGVEDAPARSHGAGRPRAGD